MPELKRRVSVFIGTDYSGDCHGLPPVLGQGPK